MPKKYRTPMEEVRAIRQKIGKKYKTMAEYCEHWQTVPSADVLLKQIRAKIARAEARKSKRLSTSGRRTVFGARGSRP